MFYTRNTKYILFFSDIYIKDYAEFLCHYAEKNHFSTRRRADALS